MAPATAETNDAGQAGDVPTTTVSETSQRSSGRTLKNSARKQAEIDRQAAEKRSRDLKASKSRKKSSEANEAPSKPPQTDGGSGPAKKTSGAVAAGATNKVRPSKSSTVKENGVYSTTNDSGPPRSQEGDKEGSDVAELKAKVQQLTAHNRKLEKSKAALQSELCQSQSNQNRTAASREEIPRARELRRTDGSAATSSLPTRDPQSDDESIPCPKYMGRDINFKEAVLDGGMSHDEYEAIRYDIGKLSDKVDWNFQYSFSKQSSRLIDDVTDSARAKHPVLWRFERNWAAHGLLYQRFRNVKNYARKKGLVKEGGISDANSHIRSQKASTKVNAKTRHSSSKAKYQQTPSSDDAGSSDTNNEPKRGLKRLKRHPDQTKFNAVTEVGKNDPIAVELTEKEKRKQKREEAYTKEVLRWLSTRRTERGPRPEPPPGSDDDDTVLAEMFSPVAAEPEIEEGAAGIVNAGIGSVAIGVQALGINKVAHGRDLDQGKNLTGKRKRKREARAEMEAQIAKIKAEAEAKLQAEAEEEGWLSSEESGIEGVPEQPEVEIDDEM